MYFLLKVLVKKKKRRFSPKFYPKQFYSNMIKKYKNINKFLQNQVVKTTVYLMILIENMKEIKCVWGLDFVQ